MSTSLPSGSVFPSASPQLPRHRSCVPSPLQSAGVFSLQGSPALPPWGAQGLNCLTYEDTREPLLCSKHELICPPRQPGTILRTWSKLRQEKCPQNQALPPERCQSWDMPVLLCLVTHLKTPGLDIPKLLSQIKVRLNFSAPSIPYLQIVWISSWRLARLLPSLLGS